MTRPARRTALLCALAAATALLPAAPVRAAEPRSPLRFTDCPDSVPRPAAPERVECGRLSVPLDRHRPRGPRIEVAVSRVRASGTPAERRGILLVNPGGPGGSGLPYAVTKRAKLPESVRRAYDVVGFDPRGVGQSTPVSCGPMGGLFDSPGGDPVPAGAPAERAYLASLRALADDCATHAGRLLPHLSTEQTAYDMDAIRGALGEPRTSFLGVSYGSWLGAAYTARFPHRVGRMVLDSVVGPWDWYDFDVIQSRALLRQRGTFFAWTAAHGERFGLGGTPGAVREAYLRVRRGLAARPVAGFGPAEFDRAVYRALGRTERWEGLADGLRGYLADGAPGGLRPATAFDGPDSRNYEAANRVVKCADGPGPAPRDIVTDIRRTRRLDPQPVLTGMEASTCAYWHHRPGHRTPLGSPDAPPVLLVASAHDPVTPVEGARGLRRLLPGARLVTLDNDYSHGVFASRGNACVDDTVAAYLVRGTVPSADVRCTGPGLPAVR
ncbi:alpha/beta hydrolase [Streptomyces purpurascens]|uniref:alpha/beta hydrolase n=1 Tax=Streptomyces purpurascens TaxID=1924 RepID=UPI0019A738E2|nr:alpha/beta hydrolase [Streptomyces purpurascens]MCE7048791.1 alpha/beta hydrolase [Streptomyces purpurascens]GGZ99290.1 tripeptidyl aminopeptidase [Streptomyces purpurascens]